MDQERTFCFDVIISATVYARPKSAGGNMTGFKPIKEIASVQPRWCASRDFTNQNALFVERFSRLERAVFRVAYGEIFALFQACVGNFDTIPPWKVVGTLYLDSSCVTFKYFAFLSVCDKFELLGHVQAAMMFCVLFRRSSWIHCWLLLAVLSDYFGHLVSSTFLLCKFCCLPWSTPVSFPL